ncbi:MAG: PIN domain-containing protein [Actinobacteria bacterium]|nr:PIN domain-containing protein [Actinomycetota bacterium]
MILVDANILLYAYDASSTRHEAARGWLEEALGGDEEIRFALITLLAFVRLSTNPSLFRNPLRSDEAIEIVIAWLEQPVVGLADPTDLHWSRLAEVARVGQAHGPLLMDAHLAALAIEHGATLCTTDRDFARFRGLRFRDPLGP